MRDQILVVFTTCNKIMDTKREHYSHCHKTHLQLNTFGYILPEKNFEELSFSDELQTACRSVIQVIQENQETTDLITGRQIELLEKLQAVRNFDAASEHSAVDRDNLKAFF